MSGKIILALIVSSIIFCIPVTASAGSDRVADSSYKAELAAFIGENFPAKPDAHASMSENYFLALLRTRPSERMIPQARKKWSEQKQELVKGVITCLGLDFSSEATALNIQEIGRVESDGYLLEKITYETRPGVPIPLNIYIPENVRPPFPAILNLYGHAEPVRSMHYIRQSCIDLAKHGYLAVMFDGWRFNEQKFEGCGHANTLLLLNTCLMGTEVWDNIRAIDYLCSRSDVDTTRLAITGFSEGGMLAIYTALVDSRIKVTAPVCGILAFENILTSEHCVCNYVPGLAEKYRMADLLSALAPAPLMTISTTRQAISPVADVRAIIQKTIKTYAGLGAGEKFAIQEFPARHEYTPAMSAALVTWLDYWFKESEQFKSSSENDAPPSESLTPKSSKPVRRKVFKNFENWANSKLTQELQRIKQPQDQIEWLHYQNKLRVDLVRELFHGFPQRHLVRMKSLSKPKLFQQNRIEKFVIESEPGILVPGLIMEPAQKKKMTIVLYLHQGGKQAAIDQGYVAELLNNEYAVITLDYRGTGETSSNLNSPFSKEQHLNRVSSFLGKPLSGRRVWDVLATIDALKKRLNLKDNRLVLIGEAGAGMVALFAAALSEEVDGLIVSQIPLSIITKDGFELPPMFYMNGLTEIGDIQHLLTGMAPRPVLAFNCLTENGAVNKFTSIHARWPRADQSYRKLKAKNALKLRYFTTNRISNQLVRWLKKNKGSF